jgi:hypothetical protein
MMKEIGGGVDLGGAKLNYSIELAPLTMNSGPARQSTAQRWRLFATPKAGLHAH